MANRANEFLIEWSLKRGPAPIGRDEAAALAEEWETEAAENGITGDELRAAAGGDVVAYLLRTYGDGELEV